MRVISIVRRLCGVALLIGSGCTRSRPAPAPDASLRLDTLRIYAPDSVGVRRDCAMVADSAGGPARLRCDPPPTDTTPPIR